MDMGNSLLTRFGVGKTMSRPTMRDMRASIDQPSLPNPPLTPQRFVASGGNPEVEPFRATAYDLSVEKYFGNKGYVSVAGFYKDIDTYVLNLPGLYDFASVLPANATIPAGGTVGFLNRPTNGKGGRINGFEFAVNIPLSMLWAPLDGFGISVNHSDTSSSITIGPGQLAGLITTPITIPLPGLSKKVTNFRAYYEKHGFQVSVASRKRSDFLGINPDYKDDVEITFIRGETVVDAQIGYTFPERSFLKGLSVLAAGQQRDRRAVPPVHGQPRQPHRYQAVWQDVPAGRELQVLSNSGAVMWSAAAGPPRTGTTLGCTNRDRQPPQSARPPGLFTLRASTLNRSTGTMNTANPLRLVDPAQSLSQAVAPRGGWRPPPCPRCCVARSPSRWLKAKRLAPWAWAKPRSR